MSVITYTALREFEATGYSKAGTDISAAAGDDSFNSVSTSLLGLADNEWALLAGFANAANNGWFQANGASILHKITQDTTTSLVTEAAGPAVTIVGYKRGLNQSYSIESNLETATRGVKLNRFSKKPIGGGAPEVIFHSRETTIDVTTAIISETSIGQWREFIASVESGETFVFDRYGTVASPVEPKTATLVSDSYTEDREGSSFVYRISFQVRTY